MYLLYGLTGLRSAGAQLTRHPYGVGSVPNGRGGIGVRVIMHRRVYCRYRLMALVVFGPAE